MSLVIRLKKGRMYDSGEEPSWMKLVRKTSKTGDLPVYIHPKLMNYMSFFDIQGKDISRKTFDESNYVAIIPEGYDMTLIQTKLIEEQNTESRNYRDLPKQNSLDDFLS